ncbi:protein of unknown function [Clostridium beijerinckii]|nr:protein of unknown function [Clostridium beijerinckii]
MAFWARYFLSYALEKGRRACLPYPIILDNCSLVQLIYYPIASIRNTPSYK